MAEYLTKASITGAKVRELCERHMRRYEESLKRIADNRDFLYGLDLPPLPDYIAKVPGADAFRVATPDNYTAFLQLRNKLASYEPRLQRYKTSTSDLAEGVASSIERFLNPVLLRNVSTQDLYDLLLAEAEATVIVVPARAHWQKRPVSFLKADNKTIDPYFERDASGRTRDQVGTGFRASRPASRRAFNQYDRHMRASNLPVEFRMLSRTQCTPINPRVRGDVVEIDGLCVKTRYTRSDLIRRNYVWSCMNDHLEPDDCGANAGEGGDFWLWEVWLMEQDAQGRQRPIVAYHVGCGDSTSNSSFGATGDVAVFDLYEECGLTRLPVVHGYGWRYATSDPNKRGIPYMEPFRRSMRAKNAFLTGKAYIGWASAFAPWFHRIPQDIDPAVFSAWMERVGKQPLVIEPGQITDVLGDMVPAIHPGTGHDVNEMISALDGSTSRELVNPLARGGGAAASAIERSVVSADTLAGVSDIRRSFLAIWKQAGEITAEILCGIARKTGDDILLYGNPETPGPALSGESPTRAVLELKPNWFGPEGYESFDLEAVYPHSLQDNLAQNQQFYEFWKNGAITDEQWCELIGVEDPDRFSNQLTYEKWKKSEQGVLAQMRDAAAYAGDVELLAMLSAQDQGAADQQGNPMGALAGLSAPPQMALPSGGPAATGVSFGNPAQSQLAASVASGIQSGNMGAISAAGGQPPQMPPVGV